MEYDHSVKSPQGIAMLENVRRICGSLPEVEEAIDGFGYTTFKVNRKSFIRMGESDAGAGLSFKSDHENQEILIQQERFVKTPYIGHHGWVSVKRGEPIDWDELSELLKEAYLRTAPKRLVKELLK